MAKFLDKSNNLYFTDFIEDFSRISNSEKDFQKIERDRFFEKILKGGTLQFDKLPDKVLVNDNVGIVWYKGKKTICKRSKDEQPDPEKAFLWAFYIANCGVSRTKAKKFLKKVLKDE